jgi:hypothetical protein
MKIIAIASAIILSSAVVANADTGSQSTNTYTRETYTGTRKASGHSQSQTIERETGYSGSSKVVYEVPVGQLGADRWNMQAQSGPNGAQAVCNAASGGDPSCYSSATYTKFDRQTVTQSGSQFSEDLFVRGEMNSHTSGSSSF